MNTSQTFGKLQQIKIGVNTTNLLNIAILANMNISTCIYIFLKHTFLKCTKRVVIITPERAAK